MASIRPVAPRRLRVLQLIDALVVGGAERLLVTLARHIDRTRYDLCVCSVAPLADTAIVRGLNALDVPIYSLGSTRMSDPRSVLALAELVRRRNVDVLHTHLQSTIIGNMAGMLAHRPVVSTLHNVHDAYPRFGKLKTFAQTRLLRHCATAVIACAPEVRAAALRRRLPADKVVDVANGIDAAAFTRLDPAAVSARRRELLGAGAGPLVIAVGTVKPAKGHEYLVEATPAIARRVRGVTVAIVGRHESNAPLVQARVTSLGLGKRVVLAGERDDAAEFIAAADLFVLPSLWEGLPLALLEAMAAGTPVVATAVGGVPRLVEDGVTGRLVPPADTEALASAIVDLLRRPEEARRLAEAGRARVRQTYGADAWTHRLESLYDRVAVGR